MGTWGASDTDTAGNLLEFYNDRAVGTTFNTFDTADQVITAVRFYIGGRAGTQARVLLVHQTVFTDQAGATLLAELGEVTTVAGWNTVSLPVPVALPTTGFVGLYLKAGYATGFGPLWSRTTNLPSQMRGYHYGDLAGATSDDAAVAWQLPLTEGGDDGSRAMSAQLIYAPANTAPTVAIDQKSSIGSTIYLPVGATLQLSATITDPDAADSGLSASWSSGTPAAATVSAGGLVTAVAEGSSIITASTTDTAGATGSDQVTIVVDNTPGAGTGVLTLEEPMQFVRQTGVATTLPVPLKNPTTGDYLTTNPLAPGDVTISIDGALPTALTDDANASAWVFRNGRVHIPVSVAQLTGKYITLQIEDADGSAYIAPPVDIEVVNYDPTVVETADDVATASAAKILATPANLLVTDASGHVTAGTVSDKTGYGLSVPERNDISDALLARNVLGGSSTGVTVSDVLRGEVDITLDGAGGFTTSTGVAGTYVLNGDGTLSLNAA